MTLPYAGIDHTKYNLMEDGAYQHLVNHMQGLARDAVFEDVLLGMYKNSVSKKSKSAKKRRVVIYQ